MTQIEHLNISASDIDEALKFINIIAPDFNIRKVEIPTGSYRRVNIANEQYYFVLQETHLGSNPRPALKPIKMTG